MLHRILEVVEATGGGLPTLRHLFYGGGRMPIEVIRWAMAVLPHTDFVNAYGLASRRTNVGMDLGRTVG